MADYPAGRERYSARPLPASRYLPGRGQRPGKRAPAGDDTFRYGVDLYNNGYWWEAHEAWEEVWLALAPNSAARHGVQAMIQTANCFLKMQMRQVRAARALRADARRLSHAALLHVPDLMVQGLAVAPWMEAVDAYAERLLASHAPAHDSARYPHIVLRPPQSCRPRA